MPATWSASGGISFLPLFQAREINAHGVVIGNVITGPLTTRPAIVRPGESAQLIPGLTNAPDLNDHEQVVGNDHPAGNVYVWTAAGGAVPVPKVPQHAGSDWSYQGLQINNAGRVIGRITFGTNAVRMGLFSWSPSTGTVHIPPPAECGLRRYEVDGIDLNDHGHIVASFTCGSNDVPVPFLYRNGAWTNLRSLVPFGASMLLGRTAAINNKGWIVGEGFSGPDDDFPAAPYALIPRVDVTANGYDGPLVLQPGDGLRIDLAFDADDLVASAPAEVYLGVVSSSGVGWFHPVLGYSLVPVPVYQGPPATFGPVPLLQVPDAGELGSGLRAWFMIVDGDANGAVNGLYYDSVVTFTP